jgi:hypothetical protein
VRRGEAAVFGLRLRDRRGRRSDKRPSGQSIDRKAPLWGAPRIHGALLQLAIDIGETSVSKYLVRRHKPVWSKYSNVLKPYG